MSSVAKQYETLLLDYCPRPIRTESQYRKTLKQIQGLMSDSKLGQAESELIDLLATLVEQYEETTHPIPASDPVDLIQHLIEERSVTRAQLARETSIPRSVITNILARRRGISAANAIKIAQRFRLPVEYFLTAGV